MPPDTDGWLIEQLQEALKEHREALQWMLSLFDDEDNFREEYQDQTSVALEKARKALES